MSSKEFKGEPSLPAGILYNRKTGGNDGDMSGSGRIVTKIGEELDDAGFQTEGYQVKKDTPFVMGAQIGYIFNKLPPGMFIDNQDVADIRVEPFKEIVDTKGYPGDGWTGNGTYKLGR